jgi:DUF2075 family protein
MTSSEFHNFDFSKDSVESWSRQESKRSNWPVVYTIFNNKEMYVGQTTNAAARVKQHLDNPARQELARVSVIVDETFNISACLDLESHLIRYFDADGKYILQNLNAGITEANYFERDQYRESFKAIFDELLANGHLTRTVPELINSDFFKYSPFKALTNDQASAVEEILECIFNSTEPVTAVIQGDPGTGKTIVAVYLLKLISDIGKVTSDDALDVNTIFFDFFQEGYREIASAMRIGLVIPQLSLRETLKRVFRKTPGLSEIAVIDPFEVGDSGVYYDLLVVDEAHRLQRRNNQSAAMRNIKFAEINTKLFGQDNPSYTQLDWIQRMSKNQVLFIDKNQSIKPADLPIEQIEAVISNAESNGAQFRLTSQMRVEGGEEYIDYVTAVLNQTYQGSKKTFGNYEVRFFEDFGEMKETLALRERDYKLARLVSGYAWKWVSKGKNGKLFDITIGEHKMKWNGTDKDWISSPNSVNEVGSIHTVQGYDLNYAGVIIGADLYFDAQLGKIMFNRANYFDVKGRENNRQLGLVFSDEDLLVFVKSIYRVLLTRGVKGTFIYVCDPALRSYIKQYF